MTTYIGCLFPESHVINSYINPEKQSKIYHALHGGGTTTTNNGENWVLFQKNGHPATQSCQHDGFTAVVDGHPWWNDDTLANIAKEKGHSFALIQGFIQYERRVFDHLRGAYSFALFHPERKIALLAIDRMGVKPMYIRFNSTILFGTNIQALTEASNQDASINQQSIFNFLYFHTIPSSATIYNDITKLQPASYLYFDGTNVETKKYWHPTFDDSNSRSIEEHKSGLFNHLRKAVERTAPGNETGSFLSGGLDSSTVSGILSEQVSGANTFSIGFSEQGYDEIEYARIASKCFNTTANEYYVTPDDILASIVDIANAYDEPYGNSSAIPAFFCAKLARSKGITTLLAGDGGDEIFAGNKRYAKQKVFNIYQQIPHSLRKLILEPTLVNGIAKNIPGVKKAYSYIEQARIDMPDRMESYNYLRRMNLKDMLTPELLSEIDPDGPLDCLRDTYNDSSEDSSLLNKMLYLDWKFTLADNDLRKVNRMCEIADVEVHYPMLDDDLVEFSTSVPSSVKLKGLELRSFYKQAMTGFLPEQILNKSKQGFGLPFGEWLKQSPDLQSFVYEKLNQFKEKNIIKDSYIDELIQLHRGGHAAYYGTMVWVILMLELWYEKYKS